HGAVLPQDRVGHIELPALDVVRIGDHTTEIDVARTWDIRQAHTDHSAGAGLGRRQPQMLRAARVEDELLHRTLVVEREEILRKSRAKALDDGRGSSLLAFRVEAVDVDLEVAGAEGDLEPALLPTCFGQGQRDG